MPACHWSSWKEYLVSCSTNYSYIYNVCFQHFQTTSQENSHYRESFGVSHHNHFQCNRYANRHSISDTDCHVIYCANIHTNGRSDRYNIHYTSSYTINNHTDCHIVHHLNTNRHINSYTDCHAVHNINTNNYNNHVDY